MSFQSIATKRLAESPYNPRRYFDQPAMDELISSVKEHGILQPILVRPMGDGFEIIAGSRRFRAAIAAGLAEMPSVVREMTDPEASIAATIENLQRADLHPLEEAEGYERIMATHAYTVEQLGEKIGKSRSYIFGRLKLLALDDDSRRLFRGGLLNPSTALLIARVPTMALRAKAIKEITQPDYNGDIPSVREAQRLLKSRYMLKLADAPFALVDTTLTEGGSCEVCPKRTGNVPDLFDDIDSPDVCTDPDCFAQKKIAQRDRDAEKVAAAGGKVIIGEEAKKLAPHGIESYTTLKGFTQLDKTCYDDPEHRTFREIIGDDADPVVIEDVHNHVMVPVIPNHILADKMAAAGVKMRESENAKANAKVEAKLVLERATRGRMFEMLRENVETLASEGGGFAFPVQAELFRAIVLRLWDRAGFDLHAPIANLWLVSGKNNTERIASFAATIPAMNEVECWQLAADLLFCHSTVVTSEWDLNNGGKPLIYFAGRFDIDEGETRKIVQDELKAKAQSEKPVKKTGKKAKNTAPAEATYPLKAAQAGELTAEKTTYPAATMTIAEFKNIPAEAAQAGDKAAENETPPAGAGLEVMVEKPARNPKPAIRYRHPDEPSLEWTGRGREPKWVTHFLAIESNSVTMLIPAEEKQSSASSEANAKPIATEPAIQKYKPSNASEGKLFFDDWCRMCERDKAMRDGLDPDQSDDDEQCKIIGDTMLYKLESPNYPSEWRYDETGQPICAAFVEAGEPLPKPKCATTIDMFQGEAL